MSKEFQTNAKVLTVSNEIKVKESGAKFQKCTVEHLDGVLKGKKFFANRTVVNAQGDEKDPVKVGDTVLVYNTISDDGKNLFSEISLGSQVDELTDLLALVGESKAEEIAEQAMS